VEGKHQEIHEELQFKFVALSQHLGTNWDVKIKIPLVCNAVGNRISEEETLLQLLLRKYPMASLQLDKILA
jgi:hypothetical protein